MSKNRKKNVYIYLENILRLSGPTCLSYGLILHLGLFSPRLVGCAFHFLFITYRHRCITRRARNPGITVSGEVAAPPPGENLSLSIYFHPVPTRISRDTIADPVYRASRFARDETTRSDCEKRPESMGSDAGNIAPAHSDAVFLRQIYRPLRTFDSITSVSPAAGTTAHRPTRIHRRYDPRAPSPS